MGSENLDARFKFFHFCYVGGTVFLVFSPPVFFSLVLMHPTLAKDNFFRDYFTKVVLKSYSIGPEGPFTRYNNFFFFFLLTRKYSSK